MNPTTASAAHGGRQASELRALLWSFRREFLIVGLCSMVANVLMLTPTLYMLQVYDRVMVSQSEWTLVALSLITLVLYGVMGLAEWARSRLLIKAGLRLDRALSPRVFDASFDANLGQAGQRPARAFADLIQLRQFLTGQGVFAFFDTPWAPIYIAVLFMMHPWLGIMAMVFAFNQGLLAWWGHRAAVAPSAAAGDAAAEAAAFLQEKLRNAESIAPMGMLGAIWQHWQPRQTAALMHGGASQALTHRITAISKFVRYAQQSLALGMGALLVIDGQLSPGAMIASNVLTSRALAPIDMLAGVWRSFNAAREAFQRLEALLRAHPLRAADANASAPAGHITLRGVSARAPSRSEPILQGIDFDARPGTVTVIVGRSGSGKSTLARVLLGIWPDVSGEVWLDGQAIERWDRLALGPHVGYLPQDIELMDGSIAENIGRFSTLDSSKVLAAAQCTGLHAAILRLPKGYDTPIGEAGQLLSAGQRQRIALARAVYGEPSLLVLDEPNANLDEAGEAALMQAVRELRAKGCTIVLITHRSGALALADQMLVLDGGRALTSGPRDDVLRTLQQQPSAAPSRANAGAAV